ncbi:hypothetical protein [Massilia timonae]|uniref:hypothetical protein n=1 Tax=Massilia timonae TaxID=47229 RepID=UPI00289FAD5B|nr:hypothetical protein [Massilia timonae]
MQWQELSIGLATGVGLSLAVFAIWWTCVGPARLDRIANERRTSLSNRLEALQHVIDSAGIGTFFWDVDRDTLRWSDHHYAIFDWPAGTPATHV